MQSTQLRISKDRKRVYVLSFSAEHFQWNVTVISERDGALQVQCIDGPLGTLAEAEELCRRSEQCLGGLQ